MLWSDVVKMEDRTGQYKALVHYCYMCIIATNKLSFTMRTLLSHM